MTKINLTTDFNLVLWLSKGISNFFYIELMSVLTESKIFICFNKQMIPCKVIYFKDKRPLF